MHSSTFYSLTLLILIVCSNSSPSAAGLKPYSENAFYWEYNGKPILLLGGFNGAHNVFIDPDVTRGMSEPINELISQMNALKKVGGNVMRCVFDPGKGLAYGYPAWVKVSDGTFDASKFTSGSNSYWGRFETLLREAQKREIIVQLEVWDRFDWYKDDRWGISAFNPARNINYTASESGLKRSYSRYKDNPFAESVPNHPKYKSASRSRKKKYDLVRRFQEMYMDKLLSISLKYDNVLYTMNNETHVDPAWGLYWIHYISNAARKKNKTVYTTDMFDDGWELQKSASYDYVFTHPKPYTFVDISQNTQYKTSGGPEAQWANILYTRDKISSSIRPINNTKIYGAVQKNLSRYHFKMYERFGPLAGQNSFWMNVLGGCASARFHRPHWGLGLGSLAKASIQAARKLETKIKLWDVEPRNDLLLKRGTHSIYYPGSKFAHEPFIYGEAYLAADPGNKYVLYFTKGGNVDLNLTGYSGIFFELSWINIDTGNWGSSRTIQGGKNVNISAPGNGGWVAALVKEH